MTTILLCLGTRKCDCPFQLIAKYISDPRSTGWKINVICGEHNHEPATFLEGHPFAKRLTDEQKQFVLDKYRQNIAPRDILAELKKRWPNNVSTKETVYDEVRRIRADETCGRTPMQSLLVSLHSSNYVYHVRHVPNSNQVHDLLLINPTSMTIWRAFPHVLILDPTYKTNRYHLPLLEIVGLTSTNKTFCIAFAFIQNEMTDNFQWVLGCLRQTLDGYMLPRVIVTDRDLALMRACLEVFPDATRLLCRYHIFENIRKKCRQSFPTHQEWGRFTARWNRVINSPTETEYVKNVTWLKDTLIDKPRITLIS